MSAKDDVIQAVHQLFDCIYRKRDLSGTMELFSSKANGFGTAAHELMENAKDVYEQYHRQFSQVDQDICYDICYLNVRAIAPEVIVAMIQANLTAALSEGPLRLNGFRRTLVFRREDEAWKIIHMHSSLPENDVQPGESYPLQAIAERNRELERMVAERTGELEKQAGELRKTQADAEAKARLVAKQNELLLAEIKERQQIEAKLRESEEQLRCLALTDQLTGLNNRRRFMEIAEQYFRQSGQAFSLFIIDIDHFKDVNDTYGHQAGDRVLQWFGACMKAQFQAGEIIGRLGGEEFGVLLPGYQLRQAVAVAEKLRMAAAEGICETAKGSIQITISIGVSEHSPADKAFDEVYLRADDALYKVKTHGRNSVAVG